VSVERNPRQKKILMGKNVVVVQSENMDWIVELVVVVVVDLAEVEKEKKDPILV